MKAPAAKGLFASRPQLAWAFYDWANSAFATTVVAGFFPVYFRGFWSAGADSAVTTARLGTINSAAGLLIALLAPLLGTIADRGGRRKRMLFQFTLAGAGATFALYFVAQGQWLFAALLYAFATLGFSGGNLFNDSLLLEVAEPRDYDRVSALGFAMGYLGGGLLFALNILMVQKPQFFGLPDQMAAVRWSFVTVAVWWVLFTLPLMRHVHEHSALRSAVGGALAAGWRELGATARCVREHPVLLWFLVAYWLYIDGVYTIVKMAVDYGMALDLKAPELLKALLLTQFVAFPSALVFGQLAKRFGPRPCVLAGLAVYAGLTIWAYFLNSAQEFYLMAVTIGLVQGGVQSLSRSMFGRLVPEGKSAEYFGFYNMVSKFGSVIGPALMGLVGLAAGPRGSILSLMVLFVGGGLILWRVRLPASK
jgi:UMF1 family MFS transporter